MNWPEKVKQQLLSQKQLLQKQLHRAQISRDSAPSPTESHSDTSRSDYERLVAALTDKIMLLDEHLSIIPSSPPPSSATAKHWSYLEITLDHLPLYLLLVPPNLGGTKIDHVQLLSTSSPLGIHLQGKTVGTQFQFNHKTGKILKIE